jgi:hypothetical protein
MQYIKLLIVSGTEIFDRESFSQKNRLLKSSSMKLFALYCTIVQKNLSSDSMAHWWYTDSPDPISQHLFPSPQLKFPVTAALRILLQAYIVRSRLLIFKHKFSFLQVSRRAP